MIKLLLIVFLSLSLNASYTKGKAVFSKKCVSCHTEFVPMNKLIKNFMRKNELLNLQAPPFNRVVHRILHGKKAKVTQNESISKQKLKIQEYLEDYLAFPRFGISVSSNSSRKMYPEKKTMRGKVTAQEYSDLVDYILEFEKYFKPMLVKKTVSINEKEVLNKAKKENKLILIEAVIKRCQDCKYTKKRILRNKVIKKEIKKNFILKVIKINKNKLPFDLKYNKGEKLPIFYIVDSKGKLKHTFHNLKKKEFLKILRKHK